MVVARRLAGSVLPKLDAPIPDCLITFGAGINALVGVTHLRGTLKKSAGLDPVYAALRLQV